MHSYGYIYMDFNIDMLENNVIADIIWPSRRIDKKKRVADFYVKGVKIFEVLNKREPVDHEKESMYRAAECIVDEEDSSLELTRTLYYTKIFHETFSLANVAQFAKELSNAYFCRTFSIAGYDEGVFQLCSFDKGSPGIVHQIGEMLEDANLSEQIGKADDISTVLHISYQQAQAFISIRDVFHAENYVISALESPS